MTNFDIFAQIISEASGKPINEVRQLTDLITSMVGSSGELHAVVPDDKAQKLLASLRTGLPGIRNWLIEGGAMVEADILRAKGKMN